MADNRLMVYSTLLTKLSNSFKKQGIVKWVRWLFLEEEKEAGNRYLMQWNLSNDRRKMMKNEKTIGEILGKAEAKTVVIRQATTNKRVYMKRLMKLTLSLLLFICFTSLYSQNQISGKWYTFSWDMVKIIEINFNKTESVNIKRDWNLDSLAGTERYITLKTIQLNDNLYQVEQDKTDKRKITVTIISSLHPDSSFILPSISEEHTSFSSMDSAIKFIKNDTFQRPGLVVYSERVFNRLKSLPDPINISKTDFKLYLEELIKSRKRFTDFANVHKDDFGFMFILLYLANQSRAILANLHYNPAIDDKQIAKMQDKYANDQDLRELIQEALKFKDM